MHYEILSMWVMLYGLFPGTAEKLLAWKREQVAPKPILLVNPRVIDGRRVLVYDVANARGKLEHWRPPSGYLAHVPGTVQGTGADRQCAGLTLRIMYGFALPPSRTFHLLQGWGLKDSQKNDHGGYYPWDDDEVQRKIEWALNQEYKGVEGDRLHGFEHWFSPDGSEPDDEEAIYGAEYNAEDPPEQPKPTPKVSAAYTFEPLTSAEFLVTQYKAEWLVKNLLVANQPGIVGGPKKVLKTSLLVDLTLSLGSGGSFLGHFNVYRPVRTAFLSGESGAATIQETALRVCKAKGIALTDADCLWDFRLPKLGLAHELRELAAGLKARDARVVIIDPLYLCLLAGLSEAKNASNLFDMGPLLLAVAEACLDVACTPLLTHHARKNSLSPFEPMELEDLAFAGIQEFARQWLLVNRRVAYVPGSGKHDLWLGVGGSCGQSGLWGIDVREGVLDEDFGGREWDVQVVNAKDARDRAKQQAQGKKEDQKRQDDSRAGREILKTLARHQGRETAQKIKEALGWRTDRFQRLLHLIEAHGWVSIAEEEVQAGKGAKRTARVVTLTVDGRAAL
jgi:replicative DNA helicase